MMDQEEQLMKNDQFRLCTRSRARHLRRKRMHDARRAEKQQDCSFNGIDVESDCKNSLSITEIVSNQEVSAENDTEDTQTITKSKARRLRKKNKNKLEESICPYSYYSANSPLAPLLKCFRTESFCYPCSCNKHMKQRDAEIYSNYLVANVFSDPFQRIKKVINNIDNLSERDSNALKSFGFPKEYFSRCLKSILQEQLETKVVTDPIISSENNTPDLNSLQTEILGSKEQLPMIQNNNNSSNITSSLDNIELDKLGSTSLSNSPIATKMTENKMNISEKTREEVKNERAAKKAAKALAKAKAKTDKVQTKADSSNKSASTDSTNDEKTIEIPDSASSENVQNKIPPSHKTNTCAKNAPVETNVEGRSKAELRAERRAKQEAQRAVKQQVLHEKTKVKTKENEESKVSVVHQIAVPADRAKKPTMPKKSSLKENTHEINLFKHLYHEREQAIVNVLPVNSHIHPKIVRLGAQYAQKVIVGSNARCVALLAAVKELIQDFERPSQADFIRGLESSLLESMAYLHHCRPSAVSMQNALRHLLRQMTQLSSALSDADAKCKLLNVIDTYIREQIQLADDAISLTIQQKVSNGDVILTYGYSSLIHKILLDTHTAEKQFRVIVVDGRPWLEGREQLRRLAQHGIECSYILINALSYVMPEVSKVFLGAHAILANGAVMSRAGTAQVALMARAFNIPVLVACETHKSYERVQTDSIVYNELGNANELAQGCGSKKCQLTNWKTKKSLNLLNITYDVTPADLVTAVVTELAILPCTSVPVILRIKPSEI
ncbi:eukaryotic translation initiation factor 2B subunit delta isoform X1 [Megalopta genalis]|uniref:eukaryotic translation initiation factor 2B subunit delta isoform X1 n=2 Tax=Megalopta genalis TaxID=115081 RepID=UPI003FD49A23